MKESMEVYGQDVKDIINYHCGSYDYPIVFDFPAGHGDRNMPFVHGYNVNSILE
jgi:muramoyltetrapeptide carboxypeptidase LdcA involved in peptidoglycan recycling